MSGIPIYTASPINASNASGITPQTAAPPSQPNSSAPVQNLATTTTAPLSTSYPEAEPGAAAMPAPTAAAKRYVPVQATPTVRSDDSPPAPQPGVFPVPSNLTSTATR